MDTIANTTRMDRRTALFEFIGFVALALLAKQAMQPVTLSYAGPITLIGTLIIVYFYMRRKGESFRTLGLRSLPGLKSKLLIIPQTALAFVAIIGTGLAVGYGGEALGIGFMEADMSGAEERFGKFAGNLPNYLIWLTLSWVSAGFAEELFFRGFLITRLETAFAGIKWAPVLAVVLPAMVFGFGHVYYQGLRGFFMTGAIGITLGALFLLYKHNIWPLIIAHGLVDSLVFTAQFMEWDI